MCRHLAYVGPAVPLATWLLDPPNSLVQQSFAPTRQRHGVVNADGFGVGWFTDPGLAPIRHRSASPVWADETFHDLARTQRATALLASVRSATATTAYGVGAAMPFRSGVWLFSHNGALTGWPDAAVPLARQLDIARLLRLDAMTDAAVLWALTLELLQAGVPLPQAVADVVARAAKVCGGRLNLLLTDGQQIVATAWGDSLSYRAGDPDNGALVASEPLDDTAEWLDVPDQYLLHITPGPAGAAHHVTVTPI